MVVLTCEGIRSRSRKHEGNRPLWHASYTWLSKRLGHSHSSPAPAVLLERSTVVSCTADQLFNWRCNVAKAVMVFKQALAHIVSLAASNGCGAVQRASVTLLQLRCHGLLVLTAFAAANGCGCCPTSERQLRLRRLGHGWSNERSVMMLPLTDVVGV